MQTLILTFVEFVTGTHVLAFDPEFRHSVLRRHRELDSVLLLGDVDVGRDLAALERHRERRRVIADDVGGGLLSAVRRQLQLAEDEEVPPEETVLLKRGPI